LFSQDGALLRLQRTSAELELQVYRQGLGNNITDIAQTDDQRNLVRYPNMATCVVVLANGNYIFEKRDEHNLGSPKLKSADGTLSAEELQRLKEILDNDELKKITTPKPPEIPADTQALREMERLDVQMNHGGTFQKFTTVKERLKTGGLVSATSGPSNGADVFLDNGAPYKKTLGPLLKWFDDLGKKNKGALKDSKIEHCE